MVAGGKPGGSIRAIIKNGAGPRAEDTASRRRSAASAIREDAQLSTPVAKTAPATPIPHPSNHLASLVPCGHVVPGLCQSTSYSLRVLRNTRRIKHVPARQAQPTDIEQLTFGSDIQGQIHNFSLSAGNNRQFSGEIGSRRTASRTIKSVSRGAKS